MSARIRFTPPVLFALVVSAIAVAFLPMDSTDSLIAAGVAAAVSVLAAALVSTIDVVAQPTATRVGQPQSAQRRRRGSFLRQSNPDTAGRARPRAPGPARA